jgi:hypothetical protein
MGGTEDSSLPVSEDVYMAVV